MRKEGEKYIEKKMDKLVSGEWELFGFYIVFYTELCIDYTLF